MKDNELPRSEGSIPSTHPFLIALCQHTPIDNELDSQKVSSSASVDQIHLFFKALVNESLQRLKAIISYLSDKIHPSDFDAGVQSMFKVGLIPAQVKVVLSA